jgi:hypothetical protein
MPASGSLDPGMPGARILLLLLGFDSLIVSSQHSSLERSRVAIMTLIQAIQIGTVEKTLFAMTILQSIAGLDIMFRPNVYKMWRLNLQYTILSKQQLLK